MPRPAARCRPSPARLIASRATRSRSTSVVNTSSKREVDLADASTRRPPAPATSSSRAGVTVPASSVTTRNVRAPVLRTSRMPSRPVSGAGSNGRLGLDLEEVAAGRGAAQLLRRAQRDQPAAGDQRDRVALLRLGHVLGRDEQRPAGRLQAVELLPDRLAQDRVDARRRLVEEQQRRARGRARRRARGAAASRPRVGRRAGPGRPTARTSWSTSRTRRRRRGMSIPYRLATKSTFSSAVRSGYRANCWGM